MPFVTRTFNPSNFHFSEMPALKSIQPIAAKYPQSYVSVPGVTIPWGQKTMELCFGWVHFSPPQDTKSGRNPAPGENKTCKTFLLGNFFHIIYIKTRKIG